MLINVMEHLVLNMLESILKDFPQVCKCDRCKEDIAAIALNGLQPLYVVSDKGFVYGKANNYNVQSMVDISAAIINAINKVKDDPHH